MKKSYLVAFIAFTIISGLVFVGCAEDRNDNTNPIAGSWILISMTVINAGEELTAGPDVVSGTMFLDDNESNWSMTITSPYLDETLRGSGQSWSANGNILTLNRNSELWTYTYSLDGNILTFTAMDNGVTVNYEWKRDSLSVLF